MTDLETIQRIELEHETWWQFRNALSPEDKRAFDELWRCAKERTTASATLDRSTFDAALMGMMLGIARKVGNLTSRPRHECDNCQTI